MGNIITKPEEKPVKPEETQDICPDYNGQVLKDFDTGKIYLGKNNKK